MPENDSLFAAGSNVCRRSCWRFCCDSDLHRRWEWAALTCGWFAAMVAPVRAFAFVALLVAGCDRPAAEVGRDWFNDPKMSTAASNPFSCATCHETTPPTKVHPGYTMRDVTTRAAWWGGSV